MPSSLANVNHFCISGFPKSTFESSADFGAVVYFANFSSKSCLAAADCHCLQSNIAVDFIFARFEGVSLAVMATKVG